MQKNRNGAHEELVGKQIKSYYFCNELGRGTSACVYLSFCEQRKEPVAIKAIPKSYLNSDKKTMELVKAEITILKACQSQNVIKCLDVFTSSLSIFIVTEYCNDGDLEQYLKNKKYLSEDHAVMHLKQILNGFKGLHEISVMHRDFKLANILLNDRVCKIADLGFAKKMGDQDMTGTMLGTGLTMAPEVLSESPYGFNADIWSIGVVFYQLLTGKYPYSGLNFRDLLRNIKTSRPNYSAMNISPLAKDLIQKCLTVDPLQRITWVELYRHPIFHKKSIELTYGITNMAAQLQSNREYYERNSFDPNLNESFRESQMKINRQSCHRELIIDEIKQIKEGKIQCENMGRNSKQVLEYNQILLTYAKKYGMYLNKVLFPLKFLRIELAEKVKEVPYLESLYLVYKKAVLEAKQFKYVTSKKINIFKIEMCWKQFLQCKFYSQVCMIVSTEVRKAELIFQAIQYQARKSQKKLIAEETAGKTIISKSFNSVLEHEVSEYAKGLNELLCRKQIKSYDLIELCEGLAFYLNHKKQKMWPEQFDRYLSKPLLRYKDAREKVLAKLKEILTVNPEDSTHPL